MNNWDKIETFVRLITHSRIFSSRDIGKYLQLNALLHPLLISSQHLYFFYLSNMVEIIIPLPL